MASTHKHRATQLGSTLAGRAGVALGALAVLVLAAPASAKVVEFTAELRAGLGDGGNPPTTSTPGANGLPACVKGLTTHLNATLPAHGFVQVNDGAAPQSIMALRPFKYGTVGAPGPMGSRPNMVAGVNGAPRFTNGTCTIMFDAAHLSGMIVGRTQMSWASWPAYNTVYITPVPTINGGGPVSRHVIGTGLEMHTVAAGGGPGDFLHIVNTLNNQFISGMAGTNTFGGGFRASGGGTVTVAATIGPGLSAQGYWFSGPRVLGHNMPTQTAMGLQLQTVTMSGTFTLNIGGMIPVLLRAWLVPLSTGTVRAEDHGGDFTTIRTQMGTDNRTSMGEMGTLTLVSPFAANLQSLDVWFGGNGSLTFTFLPEPGPTGLLAAGVLGVIALHLVYRRRQ